MSCSYYDFRCNDYYCMKKQDYVSSDIYYRYCRDYSYDDCPIYKDNGGSNCYLSTACVVAMDKPDNCEELTLLRKFRDNYMSSNPEMQKDIKEYYKFAPQIVAKINALENYKSIYREIYSNLICPCVKFILTGKYQEAYALYKNTYNDLKNKYL
ncbi:MAG: hypothetical protein IJC74_08150 [Clostridia bacterium]|nr:hypothetical protein [Clostridia bacterium]